MNVMILKTVLSDSTPTICFHICDNEIMVSQHKITSWTCQSSHPLFNVDKSLTKDVHAENVVKVFLLINP